MENCGRNYFRTSSENYEPGKISQFLGGGTPLKEENDKISKLFKVAVKPKLKPKTAEVKESDKDDGNVGGESMETTSGEASTTQQEKRLHVRRGPFTNVEKRLYYKKREENLKERKEQDKKTIFVGNVSIDATKKDLLKLFKTCGKIESVRLRSAPVNNLKVPKRASTIKKEFNDKRTSLNAYVVFADESSVEGAMQLNGAELCGLHVRVDTAAMKKKGLHKDCLFLGNLPYDAAEEKLREFFKNCGEIENVRIIRDPKLGIGKGFGYVSFKESLAVEKALLLNGKAFSNRLIRIQRSSKKSKAKDGKKSKKAAVGKVPGKPASSGKAAGSAKPGKVTGSAKPGKVARSASSDRLSRSASSGKAGRSRSSVRTDRSASSGRAAKSASSSTTKTGRVQKSGSVKVRKDKNFAGEKKNRKSEANNDKVKKSPKKPKKSAKNKA